MIRTRLHLALALVAVMLSSGMWTAVIAAWLAGTLTPGVVIGAVAFTFPAIVADAAIVALWARTIGAEANATASLRVADEYRRRWQWEAAVSARLRPTTSTQFPTPTPRRSA